MRWAILLVVLLALPSIHALEDGQIKLLAVSDFGDRQVGTTADLFLRVEPGSGEVFIESHPITRLDTQISTRFANEVVCQQLQLDCNEFNFFYTIQAESSIIGGPSAGAAVAVLTYSVLEEVPVPDTVTISGTVNSGGLIGPVGGLADKIKVASDVGAEKVLIPTGERFVNSENQTLDLVQSAGDYDVEVVEVADIWEAISHATDTVVEREVRDITLDDRYTEVMSELATQLCTNAESLEAEITADMMDDEAFERGQNLLIRGQSAFENQTLYSSASFCFGAGIQYRFLLLQDENLTIEQILKQVNELYAELDQFESSLPEPETISDAQIFAVVEERVREARDRLNATETIIEQNKEQGVFNLAYAYERLNSAEAWSEFLGQSGPSVTDQQLAAACASKIEEAQERYQYGQLFVTRDISTVQNGIIRAQEDQANGDYETCILRSAKAKAEANTFLGVFGVRRDRLSEVIDRKLEVVQHDIVTQSEAGTFPVVGFSYFEYSNSLKESDQFSSLLYAEYALELSNLNLEKEHTPSVPLDISSDSGSSIGIIIVIAIIGVAIIILGIRRTKKQPARVRSFKQVRRASIGKKPKRTAKRKPARKVTKKVAKKRTAKKRTVKRKPAKRVAKKRAAKRKSR